MHFDSLGRGDACVLNTSACAPWASHLIAFENMHFGPDFAWPREQTNVWAASGAALQAAVIRNGNYVSASMSAFVASRDSCEQLVRGEIKECELLPWDHDKTNGQPLLYFASVISRDTEELPFLYSSLAADIEDYLDGAGLQLTHGLAIAASAAGKQHLEYNGFRSLSARYLNRYEFMTITAKDARTSFWRYLLTATQNSLPPFAHECVHLETS